MRSCWSNWPYGIFWAVKSVGKWTRRRSFRVVLVFQSGISLDVCSYVRFCMWSPLQTAKGTISQSKHSISSANWVRSSGSSTSAPCLTILYRLLTRAHRTAQENRWKYTFPACFHGYKRSSSNQLWQRPCWFPCSCAKVWSESRWAQHLLEHLCLKPWHWIKKKKGL